MAPELPVDPCRIQQADMVVTRIAGQARRPSALTQRAAQGMTALRKSLT